MIAMAGKTEGKILPPCAFAVYDDSGWVSRLICNGIIEDAYFTLSGGVPHKLS